ncbi:MAG: hypothetical protein I3J02_12180 [Prevotella sp.]|nr:hypothetical protein [Prevotella sp.]
MKPLPLLSLSLLLALCSCGDTQSLYSQAYCRLYFDNSTHNDATLATAMTAYSGAFVTITASGSQFVFASNQGLSSKVNMTAVDVQRGYVLGMNGGIIVGYGTSADGTFYAYDRECPNCFDVDALPVKSYKLSVNEFGIATCSNCHRQYDMNNGGIVSSGDAGNKLSRYYATTTGPYGMLNVQ